MSEQATQLSQNQKDAAFHTLADELGIPTATIAWISASVSVLSSRKESVSAHSNSREVCAALLRDLNQFYTGDIEDGLRQMRILSSEDIGRVIWGLVSKRVIQAGAEDSVSQFDGLFRIDDLDPFLGSEGIRRKRFSWAKCKRYVSWVAYILGTALVVASYAKLVTSDVAWIGWAVGMAGFALFRVPDPNPKRF